MDLLKSRLKKQKTRLKNYGKKNTQAYYHG
jgi:hypothetical protein